jgi:hypothetical protein
VPLDELYEYYGEKHDIDPGQPFVDWLRTVKLPDTQVWDVVLLSEQDPKVEAEKPIGAAAFVKEELGPDDIAGWSVRKARDELKKIVDINLLKYAYETSRQLANKDTLTRMLRKRIQVLELTRR